MLDTQIDLISDLSNAKIFNAKHVIIFSLGSTYNTFPIRTSTTI